MPFDLNEYRNQIQSPSRPTHFYVTLSVPLIDSGDIQFRIEASVLPKISIGKIDMPFLGRKIPHAGDLVYEDWKCTVINEDGNAYRDQFEAWFAAASAPVEGLRSPDFAASHLNYKGTGTVTMLAQDGTEVKTYNIICYPRDLGEVELGWNKNDAYVSFDVVFAIDYWEGQ